MFCKHKSCVSEAAKEEYCSRRKNKKSLFFLLLLWGHLAALENYNKLSCFSSPLKQCSTLSTCLSPSDLKGLKYMPTTLLNGSHKSSIPLSGFLSNMPCFYSQNSDIHFQSEELKVFQRYNNTLIYNGCMFFSQNLRWVHLLFIDDCF